MFFHPQSLIWDRSQLENAFDSAHLGARERFNETCCQMPQPIHLCRYSILVLFLRENLGTSTHTMP